MFLVEHSSLEEEYVTDQRAVGVSQGKRGKINCPQIRLGARRRLKFQTDASCKEKRHGSFLVIVIVLATSDNSEFLHMLRFMLMFDAQSIFTIYSQLRLYYFFHLHGLRWESGDLLLEFPPLVSSLLIYKSATKQNGGWYPSATERSNFVVTDFFIKS